MISSSSYVIPPRPPRLRRSSAEVVSPYWHVFHSFMGQADGNEDGESGLLALKLEMWPWVKTYGTIFGWMNIHRSHLEIDVHIWVPGF